jgi:hypothetical protein
LKQVDELQASISRPLPLSHREARVFPVEPSISGFAVAANDLLARMDEMPKATVRIIEIAELLGLATSEPARSPRSLFGGAPRLLAAELLIVPIPPLQYFDEGATRRRGAWRLPIRLDARDFGSAIAIEVADRKSGRIVRVDAGDLPEFRIDLSPRHPNACS